jgi:hypothetical protein
MNLVGTIGWALATASVRAMVSVPQKRDGERKPYAPRDGERKPYVKRDGERKPYAPRDGERKPYAPRDAERKRSVTVSEARRWRA